MDSPLWTQKSFIGRLRHFAWLTDPRTIFYSDKRVDKAKSLLDLYRQNKEPPGTSKNDIIFAKKLVDSCYHPDTGEKMNVLGRMSFQVPANMLITGTMLQFYKTIPQVIFWQWVNQSYNAFVNFTNRNANSVVTKKQLISAYIMATASALLTAIFLKLYWAKNSNVNLQRYIPFFAVAASNFVNIPLMRQNEIINGVDIFDENDRKIGVSKLAAIKGISQVILSRIVIAAPGMILTPPIMQTLEEVNWLKKFYMLYCPIQVLLAGLILTFMVPTGCALFPQKCSIRLSTIKKLESFEFEKSQNGLGLQDTNVAYFNKGL